jgi:ribosomal-protein-alanine N-acetyltransferase
MLRPVTPGDAPLLAALRARAFETPWSVQAFAELLCGPGAFGFVHERGFSLARVAVDEAELLLLAVDPDDRRRGLGRDLLGTTVEEAARRGAALMFLEVADDNAPALALYADAGFEAVGRRPGYYPRPQGPAADALTLRRALSPPEG